VGCEEENYQKDLHDLLLLWNLASTTPLFIGECGHERTRQSTGQSKVAHQKSSLSRTPLFNARSPGPAHRATASPLGDLPPCDPPMRSYPQRGGSRCTHGAVTGHVCRPRHSTVPAPQSAIKTDMPPSCQRCHLPKAGARTGRWDAPTRGHQAESSGFVITKITKPLRGL